jgi:hypothetical protein
VLGGRICIRDWRSQFCRRVIWEAEEDSDISNHLVESGKRSGLGFPTCPTSAPENRHGVVLLVGDKTYTRRLTPSTAQEGRDPARFALARERLNANEIGQDVPPRYLRYVSQLPGRRTVNRHGQLPRALKEGEQRRAGELDEQSFVLFVRTWGVRRHVGLTTRPFSGEARRGWSIPRRSSEPHDV